MTTYTVIQLTEGMNVSQLNDFAGRIEALGYDGLWVPELDGREPVALSGHLLANTTTLNIGIGIANVYVRDFVAAAQVRQTLAELSGGRFWLGLGVSHPLLVEPRGHTFLPPTQALGNYLRGIHATEPSGPKPASPGPIVCAAHGPNLLAISRDLADGAFCLNQPPEHTARAREILGADKRLCIVVRTVLEPNVEAARQMARQALDFYVKLPAYHRTWKAAGYDESDFNNGGSDRLIDAIFALGDEKAIERRIQSHIDAGASEICFYPVNPAENMQADQVGGLEPAWDILETFAPGR